MSCEGLGKISGKSKGFLTSRAREERNDSDSTVPSSIRGLHCLAVPLKVKGVKVKMGYFFMC
jgi:hypothetical protein